MTADDKNDVVAALTRMIAALHEVMGAIQANTEAWQNYGRLIEEIHQACIPDSDPRDSPLVTELRRLASAVDRNTEAVNRLERGYARQPSFTPEMTRPPA